ncbi:MAG: hypothetical protein AB1403_10975 [Candidatus Riflebacteria bacterium]
MGEQHSRMPTPVVTTTSQAERGCPHCGAPFSRLRVMFSRGPDPALCPACGKQFFIDESGVSTVPEVLISLAGTMLAVLAAVSVPLYLWMCHQIPLIAAVVSAILLPIIGTFVIDLLAGSCRLLREAPPDAGKKKSVIEERSLFQVGAGTAILGLIWHSVGWSSGEPADRITIFFLPSYGVLFFLGIMMLRSAFLSVMPFLRLILSIGTDRQAWKALRKQFWVPLFFVVTVAGYQAIQSRALEAVTARAEPAVQAIEAFCLANDRPPRNFHELVPEFLPATPTTGLRGYPTFHLTRQTFPDFLSGMVWWSLGGGEPWQCGAPHFPRSNATEAVLIMSVWNGTQINGFATDGIPSNTVPVEFNPASWASNPGLRQGMALYLEHPFTIKNRDLAFYRGTLGEPRTDGLAPREIWNLWVDLGFNGYFEYHDRGSRAFGRIFSFGKKQEWGIRWKLY